MCWAQASLRVSNVSLPILSSIAFGTDLISGAPPARADTVHGTVVAEWERKRHQDRARRRKAVPAVATLQLPACVEPVRFANRQSPIRDLVNLRRAPFRSSKSESFRRKR
jgi:hypothetical protein